MPNQPEIYKTTHDDVYMLLGNKRVYLGKAVVHESEHDPATKDHLRTYKFGTELTSEGLEDYKKKHRD